MIIMLITIILINNNNNNDLMVAYRTDARLATVTMREKAM